MKKIHLLLFLIVIEGCAPTYLVPVDYSTEMDNYQTYIEADAVSFSLECTGVHDNLISFWLEITNLSADTLHLNLYDILSYKSYLPLDEAKQMEVSNSLTSKTIENLYQEKKSEAKVIDALMFTLSIALVAADMSADQKASYKREWTHKDERHFQNRKELTGLGFASLQLAATGSDVIHESILSELQYLPEELFRSHAIPPGEIHAGKIVFLREAAYKYYRIQLHADEKAFNFDFRKAKAQENQFIRTQISSY